MSGGVDSSVAAALLLREGYDVLGCFMRLGSAEEEAHEPVACDTSRPHHQGCCSVNDAHDARHVASMLGIPLYVLNFRREFGRVMDYFASEYHAGRTPNPCVRCNDWLKFGKLAEYARSMDADYVATGHYARIVGTGHGARLARGVDTNKDQSYVLFGVKRGELTHMVLPIGGYDKPTIRSIAKEVGLPVFDKPDSQEVCFVPDNDYAAFVRRHTGESRAFREGDILDTSGHAIGRHGGHQNFTIGQRRGVGVALGYPIYVIDRDPVNNTVTVGGREDLMSTGLEADQCNWHIEPPTQWTACGVKVRYNSRPTPAKVRCVEGDRMEVRFDEPISAVTPGQAVVCYEGETVMGGGWINRATRD